MNVLYDISSLGYGHEDSRNRTGISRAVEALAYALVAADDCCVTFCAQKHSNAAGQYMRSNPKLQSQPFVSRAYKDWIAGGYNDVNRKGDGTTLPQRVGRKAWHLLYYTLGPGGTPFTTSALAGANVYHSTFQPLPRQVKRARLGRLLTVYDLTPILLPQYFNVESAHLKHSLVSTLQSVGPEDTALCISQATKDDFCRYTGHDPARASVLYLAADRSLFYVSDDEDAHKAIKEKYGIPRGPYILGLSTLAPHKNIEHVIRCFVRLAQEQDIADLCLVLAGAKGWGYERIFAELEAAPSIKERIIITGRVDDADLAALYSGALAFTYMSHYEGFGLPPLEAMQCGVPVVTSNTSSLPEVVGEAGIMLAPDDADGLCHSLWRLYQDAGLRQAMTQKSLERAGLFSWERCARETIAAYRLAMARL